MSISILGRPKTKSAENKENVRLHAEREKSNDDSGSPAKFVCDLYLREWNRTLTLFKPARKGILQLRLCFEIYCLKRDLVSDRFKERNIVINLKHFKIGCYHELLYTRIPLTATWNVLGQYKTPTTMIKFYFSSCLRWIRNDINDFFRFHLLKM